MNRDTPGPDRDTLSRSADDVIEEARIAFEEEQEAQATEAMIEVEEQEQQGRFLRWPWRALHRLTGNLVPGDLWYVCAFSGHGKTSFLMSMLELLWREGKSVYFMGLETRPKVLRTEWACRQLGIHPGDALSGKLLESDEGKRLRHKIIAKLSWQALDREARRVMFSPVDEVTVAAVDHAAAEARHFGADVFVIDHIDHVDLDSARGSQYERSVAVNRAVMRIAQRQDMLTIVSSQLNNDALRGDRLRLYRPPTPELVQLGGHKRQVATGMIGLYRPLREDVTAAELRAFRKSLLEPKDITAPNTMGAVLMKHRRYGEREGQRERLRIERGMVSDWDSMAEMTDRARLQRERDGIPDGVRPYLATLGGEWEKVRD